jgi:hypothetical protein
MSRPVEILRGAAQRVWSAVAGSGRARSPGATSPVIFHDPDANKPKNLDDPFQDPKVQERVAKLISQAAAAPRMKPGED